MSLSTRRIRILLIFLPLLALLISGCAGSLRPEYSYQGRLLDASGNPVPDGNYEMTYSVYNTLSGGTEVFSQTQTIPVEGGLFTTAVGPSVGSRSGDFLSAGVDGSDGGGRDADPTAAAARSAVRLQPGAGRGCAGIGNARP